MTEPVFAVVVAYDLVRITCGGVLHVRFRLSDWIALQSWKDTGKWCIEYSFRDGAVLLTEYDTSAKWKSILTQLDEIR